MRRMTTLIQIVVLGSFLSLLLPVSISAQSNSYDNARSLVNRVQDDLQSASQLTQPTKKEQERFHNAQHHLSQFDKKLARGKFDKGKLDQAIDDVKNVIDNNTISSADRDTLNRDIADLRQLRSNGGRVQ